MTQIADPASSLPPTDPSPPAAAAAAAHMVVSLFSTCQPLQLRRVAQIWVTGIPSLLSPREGEAQRDDLLRKGLEVAEDKMGFQELLPPG